MYKYKEIKVMKLVVNTLLSAIKEDPKAVLAGVAFLTALFIISWAIMWVAAI